jgi:hypothetical protein
VNASPAARDLRIDVVIPCHEKDAWILPRAIAGAKRNVMHRIDRIFVVAPESAPIRSACAELSCEFVLEDAAAPLRRRDVRCSVNGVDRSGWIYQQLIKLSADRISNAEYMLMLDADTVLVGPHVFRQGGQTIFFVSTDRHDDYFDAYARLLGPPSMNATSFITHYMLFERRKLAALRGAIEAAGGRPWYGAVLALGEIATHISFFSEYETYGTFCLSNFGGEFLIERDDNLSLPPSWIAMLPIVELAGRKRSVSLHHHSVNHDRAATLQRFLRSLVSREA